MRPETRREYLHRGLGGNEGLFPPEEAHRSNECDYSEPDDTYIFELPKSEIELSIYYT